MDHPCYKCGYIVEDGKAFCSQCNAPQIRVSPPESLAPALTETVPSSDLAAVSSDPSIGLRPAIIPTSTDAIEWARGFRACAAAALIAALVMALGLMVPLLASLCAGFLAIFFYHQRNPPGRVNARSGAKLGAICGVLFFGMSAIFEAVAVALFHSGGQIRQKILEALQQAASRSTDPQVLAAFERLKTPDGLAAMLILGMVALFVVSIAAGSLAGAVTGALLDRRNRS